MSEEEAEKARAEAEARAINENLDGRLEQLADVQRRADVRQLVLTLRANGEVEISMIKSSADRSVPYARVDRVTRKLTRL